MKTLHPARLYVPATYAGAMTPGSLSSPLSHQPISSALARPRTLIVALVLTVTVASLAFVGTADAAAPAGQYAHGNGTDTSPPTMANGSKINATTVAVTIADTHDVDESTIEASDFLLSKGSIRNVTVTEEGPNATARLFLDRRLNQDNLTVVLAAGGTILDTNGNELNASATDSFVIVPNMDTVAPAVQDFTVTNATGGPATIRVEARESLSTLYVSVSGPEDTLLDRSDFEASESGRVWKTTYRPPEDGPFFVALENVTDRAGNTRDSARDRRQFADLTPPNAVASLDLARSQNLTIAFDAGQSSDANGITQYRWSFGDGDSATGPSVAHDYLPGNYTVRLTVTDTYGNVATDTIALNLTTGSGNVDQINESDLRERAGNDLNVTVQRPGDGMTDYAFVGVENARQNESIGVGTLDGGQSLAVHGPVSLDGIAVTLARNRSFDLGLSLAGNGSVADAAAATGTTPLAGFTVVNTVDDDEIANATIRFSVEQSSLERVGVAPANVSLYRLHGGSWNAVPTGALNASDGRRAFRAETPGFSRFAVAADVPTYPNFTVTDATLDTQQVTPGDPFSVTATVENSGNAGGTFTGGLAANGTVVATATTTIAADDTATLTLESRTTDTGTYELSVNDTVVGTITVAAQQSDDSPSNDTQSGTENESEQFVVTNAELGASNVDVDEPFVVNATIENRGDERGAYTAALEVNGSVVTTKMRPIPPGESLTVQLNYLINRSGKFPITVNGTSAGTLTVGDVGKSDSGSGGLLASLFGVLPMGLLTPFFMFIVAPLFVIWAILKALAIYLGY